MTEEGSEAAAAVTARVQAYGLACDELPPCVVVDHPFLFVITDNRTRAGLFLGRVADLRA